MNIEIEDVMDIIVEVGDSCPSGDEKYVEGFNNALRMVRETLKCYCNSWESVDDITAKTMKL